MIEHKPLNRDEIKYIAMATMLLNHIADIFLKTGTWLCEIFTAIGYFTAITMIYFLVEGYGYTHSRKNYLLRLLLFGVISEIPYCLAFTTDGVISYYGLNMMFTLALCFGLIWIFDAHQNRIIRVAAAATAILLSALCSWALLAPVFTLLFIWAKGSENKKAATFIVSTILFGVINFIGGIGRFTIPMNILFAVLGMIGMGLSGVCIIFLYNGKRADRGRSFSKWFFYLFYPVHLLVLGIIRIMLQR